MNRSNRTLLASGALLITATWLLSGCNQTSGAAQAAGDPFGRTRVSSSRSLASGTRVGVALDSDLSSETARVGDAWQGFVTENVISPNGAVIPAGSPVSGVVSGVNAASRGSRAMLELEIRSIRVNGQEEPIAARSEPVIAGSAGAQGPGAVAGFVTGSRREQVVLSDDTTMSFTVSHTVAMP